jgi:TetR/AcrR family transcriptional regulator
LRVPIADTAALLLAVVEGSITRYVRSEFQSSPVAGWDKQWELLRKAVFNK